jgi:parallel beta-helix repeat protein
MIQLQNAYNVTIDDMYIHNGLGDAIILVREPGIPRDINSRIYHNRIHNDGHDGIYVEYAENFEIYDNIITNTRTDASIRVQNCNNLKIYNNIAGNAPDRRMSGVAAVHVENRGDVPVDNIEIYGNYFYGNQTWHGIWLEREANGTGSLNSHTGVYIHNNIISQYRLAGIGIYGFNNTRIENNLIEISAEGAGIAFYQGDPVNSSLSGFTTYVKNNIIVYNKTYGLDNQQPSIHTFVSNDNDIYGNESGAYHHASSATDIYADPLLASDYEYHGRYYNATSYYILSLVWADADDEQDGENPVCKTDLGAMKARAIYHLVNANLKRAHFGEKRASKTRPPGKFSVIKGIRPSPWNGGGNPGDAQSGSIRSDTKSLFCERVEHPANQPGDAPLPPDNPQSLATGRAAGVSAARGAA